MTHWEKAKKKTSNIGLQPSQGPEEIEVNKDAATEEVTHGLKKKRGRTAELGGHLMLKSLRPLAQEAPLKLRAQPRGKEQRVPNKKLCHLKWEH